MKIQTRNADLVESLSADFVRSYSPITSWGNAMSMYQSLHALRGFWPMSSFDENGDAQDLSGQGRHLTRTAVVYGTMGTQSPIMPYVAFTSNRYLYRLGEPGLDITGTEAFVGSAAQGLTVGCWLYPNAGWAADDDGIMSKYGNAGSRSWLLYRRNTGNTYSFLLSGDGTTVTQLNAGSCVANVWTFVVARFDKLNGTIDVWVNDTKYSIATAIASVFVSTQRLEVGSWSNGLATTTWAHRQTLNFLCASALPDRVIGSLFEHTRGFFGV